ncbi:MAG: hypothetical protein IKL20_07885 [Alistipes sp.]|nr:hypothetical protein [Alistipes sp.]
MKRFLLIIALFCVAVCSAKQYKISSIRDAVIRIKGNKVEINHIYDSEKDALDDVEWKSPKGYIIVNDLSDGTSIVLRPNSLVKSDESVGLLERIKDILISIKNCSTRAAENELLGGLDNYLSQTFYLSCSDENLSRIFVASDLQQNDTCYFKLKVLNTKTPIEIKITPSRGFTLPLLSLREYVGTDELTKLRCRVSYVSGDGREVVITNTMNIVLLP